MSENNEFKRETRNAPSSDDSLPKKAAFYLAKGARAIGNHRLSVNVDLQKYYSQATQSSVGKGAANAWTKTKEKTNEKVKWARKYNEELPGDGITHRRGEDFLRTQQDMRTKMRRGDLVTIDGETFMISKDENDEFTEKVVPLRSPKNGIHPGFRVGSDSSNSRIHRVGDRFANAASATGAGLAMVGGAAAAAAALTVQKAVAVSAVVHDKARYYETPVACSSIFKNNSSVIFLKVNDTEDDDQLKEKLALLDVVSTPQEVPDCLVTVLKGSTNAETTTSLVGIVKRGDSVQIENEMYKVATGITRRFHATQLPLDHAREGESAELVPLYTTTTFKNCMRIPDITVNLEKGSQVCKTSANLQGLIKRGDFVIIGGERYQVGSDQEKMVFSSTSLPLESKRVGKTVTQEPIYLHNSSSCGVEVPDCLVNLNQDSCIVETSTSLIGMVRRGDDVIIGDEQYTVSTNLLKRFTSTQIPLDSPRKLDSVMDVPIVVISHSKTDEKPNVSTTRRKLRRGDRIRIGDQTFSISMDESVVLDDTQIPVSSPKGKNRGINVVGDLENAPIYLIGDRVADAAAKTSAAAHWAAKFREPIGECQLLVHGSAQMFTVEDMRGKLKRGDKITVGGQELVISKEGEFSSDCVPLDAPYLGTTISRTERRVGNNIQVVEFLRGSTTCYVSGDVTSRVKRGDSLVIGGENFVVSMNENHPFTSKMIPLENARVGRDMCEKNRVIEDCLVSIDRNSKTVTTTSSLIGRVRRGDELIIGGEKYTVSNSLLLRRFTATQVPVDEIRQGESVDLVPFEIVAYQGDRVIHFPSATETTIYKQRDRLDEYQKDQIKNDSQQRLQAREREKKIKDTVKSIQDKTNSQMESLEDRAENHNRNLQRKMKPKVDKITAAAYVTQEKIGNALEPGARKLGKAAKYGANVASETASNTMERVQPLLDNTSRKVDRANRQVNAVFDEIREGTSAGLDAGAGPIKRHNVDLRFNVYAGRKNE